MEIVIARLTSALRSRVRPGIVKLLGRAPLRILLGSRERFDHSLRTRGRKQAPLLLRLARFRPVPEAVDTFHPPGRPDITLVNSQSFETQLLYWLGFDECTSHSAGIPLWETLCSRAQSVVEIGAHLGVYTVCGAQGTGARYRVFEPHPGSARALRANLERNNLARVEVIEAAVVPDDWNQPVNLFIPAGRDGSTPSGASVVDSGEPAFVADPFPVTAAIEGCDLLKVDVEGFESVLLSGALANLKQLRPLLMVEVLDGNRALRAMLPGLIRTLDARPAAMRRSSLEPVDLETFASGLSLQARYGTWDFLIVPEARADMVRGLIAAGGAGASTTAA